MCGAGPSLEKNAHWLRRADLSKVLVLAVDAALPYLWSQKIIPHIVVTAEEQCRAAMIFRHLGNWFPGVACALSTTTNPFCIALLTSIGCDRFYFYHNAHPLLSDMQGRFRQGLLDFKIPSIVPQFGSITAHALELARMFGVQEIALIGVDMGVADESKTHAGPYQVVGINANTINQAFDVHRREMIHRCVKQMGVVNATEGGCLEVLPKTTLAKFLEPYMLSIHQTKREPVAK